MFRKGAFDSDKLPSEEEFRRTIYEMGRATESRTVRVEIDRAFQEEHDRKLDMFKFQEHDAIEKRDAYYELKEKRDAIFADYDVLETEKKAIDKAINTIMDISEEFSGLFAGIDGRVSDILSALSGGQYQEAKLDDEMHVAVKRMTISSGRNSWDMRSFGRCIWLCGWLLQRYLTTRKCHLCWMM